MKFRRMYLFLMAGFLSACNGGANADYNEQEQTATEDTVAGGAQAYAATDTTLQEVDEVTLRAIGNTLQEIAYEPDTLEVKAGSLVKLKLVNEGAEQPMMHNVIITYQDKYKLVATEGAKIGSSGNYTPLDSSLVIAASPMAKPGQTVELDFRAPLAPGKYDFVCSYPQHYERMHGVLIVH
jgi:azurin